MVEEFDKLNVSFRQNQGQSLSMESSSYSLGSRDSALSYKMCQSSAVSIDFGKQFHYKSYVEESLAQARRTKRFEFIDLSDD